MVNTLFTGDNNYRDFARFLGERNMRKLANNTYVHRQQDYKNDVACISITLHGLEIITYWPDGSVSIDLQRRNTLNFSGANTHKVSTTTIRRVRQFSPCDAYTKAGITYIDGVDATDNLVSIPAPKHWYANHSMPGYLPSSEASDFGEYRNASEAIAAIKDSYEQLFDDMIVDWYEPVSDFVYALCGAVFATPTDKRYEVFAWSE